MKSVLEGSVIPRLKKHTLYKGKCWLYTAQPSKLYPSIRMLIPGLGLKKLRVYKAAYIELIGPVPKGKQLNHHCDNPSCWNVYECVYAGTQSQNMRDRVNRGRWKGPRAKLTEKQVREVELELARGIAQTVIAERFGVNQSKISRVKLGKVRMYKEAKP